MMIAPSRTQTFNEAETHGIRIHEVTNAGFCLPGETATTPP
ncbi:hypothetical protein [Streptomyces griseoluteus]